MTSNQRIASGRAMLAAEVVGSGDPVIFLHSDACDRRMWRAQLDGVGGAGKAIAYDRRGCGGTRAGKEDFSAVADLMAAMDAAADGRPAIPAGWVLKGSVHELTGAAHAEPGAAGRRYRPARRVHPPRFARGAGGRHTAKRGGAGTGAFQGLGG